MQRFNEGGKANRAAYGSVSLRAWQCGQWAMYMVRSCESAAAPGGAAA